VCTSTGSIWHPKSIFIETRLSRVSGPYKNTGLTGLKSVRKEELEMNVGLLKVRSEGRAVRSPAPGPTIRAPVGSYTPAARREVKWGRITNDGSRARSPSFVRLCVRCGFICFLSRLFLRRRLLEEDFKNQQPSPYHNRAIGHVESWPLILPNIKKQEIHYLPTHQPVP
jgi:hypothetical protein